ncbi:MAG: di-heme enzyme [Gammaproteobacteria bacterium]|nr:di-heme enzyme [Gammaproteobacteria bacterium]
MIAAVLTITLWAAPAAPYQWKLPAGFPSPLVPVGNPMTPAKVALGERLFSDPRLSLTGTWSCASCHDPARAFTDGRTRAVGATGEVHARNTPTLVNAAYGASLGWLADAPQTLEAQHRIPLTNRHPVELGFESTAALAEDQAVRALYPDGFGIDELIDVLASYTRTLIFADSPFDRYVYYGEPVLSEPARQGLMLFLSPRTGCSECHRGFTLSGPSVHALSPDTQPAFHDGVRAPTLRNVAVTGPYLHDGSIETLAGVIDFYASQGRGEPVPLSAEERGALVAFMKALTDRRWRGD